MRDLQAQRCSVETMHGDDEGYGESGPTNSDFTSVIDRFTASPFEGVAMSGVSPSVPDALFNLPRTALTSDDAFVDVDLWYP